MSLLGEVFEEKGKTCQKNSKGTEDGISGFSLKGLNKKQRQFVRNIAKYQEYDDKEWVVFL